MATRYKCNFCAFCAGEGCIDQIPGMGGTNGNENFQLNVIGWGKIRNKNAQLVSDFLKKKAEERIPRISIAPITGAVENIGMEDEKSYYGRIIQAAHNVGLGLCIGDGFPDEKLKFGIEALSGCKNHGGQEIKAGIFIKPYPNEKIFERIDWAKNVANVIGIDIDAFNLVTMRNLVRLEKKTAAQLIEIKRRLDELNIPFAIKGVFTEEDMATIRAVRPSIAYISNHGGRIDTRRGSTADFFFEHVVELKKYCDEVWVDGGIRTPLDVATAFALGADRVLVGRPFITALLKNGVSGLCQKVLELSLLDYGK